MQITYLTCTYDTQNLINLRTPLSSFVNREYTPYRAGDNLLTFKILSHMNTYKHPLAGYGR